MELKDFLKYIGSTILLMLFVMLVKNCINQKNSPDKKTDDVEEVYDYKYSTGSEVIDFLELNKLVINLKNNFFDYGLYQNEKLKMRYQYKAHPLGIAYKNYILKTDSQNSSATIALYRNNTYAIGAFLFRDKINSICFTKKFTNKNELELFTTGLNTRIESDKKNGIDGDNGSQKTTLYINNEELKVLTVVRYKQYFSGDGKPLYDDSDFKRNLDKHMRDSGFI